MMDLAEQLFAHVAREVLGTTKLTYQGTEIDLTPPWLRLSMVEAIKKETGIDWLEEATDDETAIAIAKKLGLNVKDLKTKGQVLDEVFGEFVEPKLIQPTFIVDYPIEVSLLAKRKPDQPDLTDRFRIVYLRPGDGQRLYRTGMILWTNGNGLWPKRGRRPKGTKKRWSGMRIFWSLWNTGCHRRGAWGSGSTGWSCF